MAEWSNAPDSKSGIRFLPYRGFESLSLRQMPSIHAPFGRIFVSTHQFTRHHFWTCLLDRGGTIAWTLGYTMPVSIHPGQHRDQARQSWSSPSPSIALPRPPPYPHPRCVDQVPRPAYITVPHKQFKNPRTFVQRLTSVQCRGAVRHRWAWR